MEHIFYLFSSLISLFLSFATAFSGAAVPYAPLEEDIELNVALISDTHIDSRLPLGKLYLETAFKDMNTAQVKNDALVVCGDLTNYGEEAGIVDFFEIMTSTSEVEYQIIAMGNHDIGHTRDLGITNDEASLLFKAQQ